jgi:predicted aconitase with swiveling domain
MNADGFEIVGSMLIPGQAVGPALVLDDRLSFWGGFDPQNGEIIDVHHPQFGQLVGGTILFIPESRGSAGTPGGIAETLRNGSGPLAFVLGERDVNISVGTLVANRLYSMNVPVLEITPQAMSGISSGDQVEIDPRGVVSVRPKAG